MHEILPDHLWLGHALDARDTQRLIDVRITAVVDLAYEELPAKLPRQFVYCRFPLNDGGGNSASILRQAVQTVVDLLASENRTLVACSAGMSRSPTITSFGVGFHLNQDPVEVLNRISKIRSLEIKPDLWNDVAKIFDQIRRSNFS